MRHEQAETDRSGRPKINLRLVMMGVIVLAVIAIGVFALQGTKKTASVDQAIKAVYLLEQQEEPSYITIQSDKDLATTKQMFLDNAQKDDIVVVYEKNRTAILYRPSIEKIIATTLLKDKKS